LLEKRPLDEPHQRESELEFFVDNAAWIAMRNKWGWSMSVVAELEMSHLEKIKNVVDREAKKLFCKADVGSVYIHENEFRDVLHISIFVEDTDSLESNDALGFIGYLQETLENELNEERFPLISYFPNKEEKWFISRMKKGFFS